MSIVNFFNLILKNIKLIMLGLIIVLAAFLFHQHSKTKEYKDKYKMATHIADQNLAAINDSSIQLKLTKEQLAIVDSKLYNTLNKVDSLQQAKSKQITIIKPVYVPVYASVINQLKYDQLRKMYGLDFKSIDSVRTIDGTSWFMVIRDTNNNNISIIPDSTIINDFKFNFTFVVSQYEDKLTHFTKTKITPFYMDTSGNLGKEISENQIKFNFRNLEVLDKPWQENSPIAATKGKYKFQSGWGLFLSPIGVGYNTNKFIYTPSISFGYYITLRKK